MVSIDDISYAFKNYFSNFINSISLDEKLLAPAPKEEWIRRLQDCARFQASVRQEDQHVIHSLNTLLTEQSDTLTAAHYDTILKYCRKLYYANSNEPPILLDLAQKLIPHYERLMTRKICFFSTAAPDTLPPSFPALTAETSESFPLIITKKSSPTGTKLIPSKIP